LHMAFAKTILKCCGFNKEGEVIFIAPDYDPRSFALLYVQCCLN